MNPRIQVEHTVTEMVTGIDIVQAQILIAEGHRLDSREIGIKGQDDIKVTGHAIQCRITTGGIRQTTSCRIQEQPNPTVHRRIRNQT